MYTDNLFDFLLSELILFILKYLSERNLKNFCSINNIWKKKANLKWSKRMEFLFKIKDQGNYMVKEFYSKLKECNLSKEYSEKHLK